VVGRVGFEPTKA